MIAISFSSVSSLMIYSSLLSLDPEQKDQLIEVIEKLLADKTTVGGFLFLPSPHHIFLLNKFKFKPENRHQHLCTAPDCM